MRRVSVAVALLGLALVGFFVLSWDRVLWEVTTPRNPAGEDVVVIVPPSADAARVLEQLRARDLVRSSRLTGLYVRAMRDSEPLHPGEYRLSPALSLVQMLETIEAGDVVVHTVVLRPGWTAERMGEVLEEKAVVDRSEFLRSVRDPEMARLLGVPAESLDGFLFPDVYAFPRGMAAEDVAKALVARFFESVPTESFPEGVGATRDLVRIAGLLEAAPVPTKDWRLYAGLLWARRESGQTLMPRPEGLRGEDPVLFGPYDPRADRWATRALPNPGLEALRAAARPARPAPRFLIRREDGGFAYCADLDCFYDALRPL